MNTAREKIIANAIAHAVNTLEQLGCSYTITDANGAATSNVKQSHKRRNDFSALNITDRLLGSSIGEEIFFECPEGVDPLSLQSAICGHASKVFGSKEHYTTKADRNRKGVLVMCGMKRPIDLSSVIQAQPKTATTEPRSLQ